jgi:hypothetical protein
MSCSAPSALKASSHDLAALSGCQDGRPCRHRFYVPAGMILVACRCLDCDPRP